LNTDDTPVLPTGGSCASSDTRLLIFTQLSSCTITLILSYKTRLYLMMFKYYIKM